MTILVCDIGGTHIRFSLGETPVPHKSRVDAHAHLPDAIQNFLQSQSVLPEEISMFYFAFSNRNAWNTDEKILQQFLPKARIRQVNDFEANAYGVVQADENDLILLNKPNGDKVRQASKAVVGVGTGLGLAYVYDANGRAHIQRSHGGHMLPARSVPHEGLYQYLLKDSNDALIYEDILSGRGLYAVYAYLSDINHLDREYVDIETLMLQGKDNPVFQQALIIFYEMLGLFAHHTVAFGYAYDGIYLTGGVIDRLMLAGLFKPDVFLSTFRQNNVPIVQHDVSAAPIYWLKDEFISLRGLLKLAEADLEADHA